MQAEPAEVAALVRRNILSDPEELVLAGPRRASVLPAPGAWPAGLYEALLFTLDIVWPVLAPSSLDFGADQFAAWASAGAWSTSTHNNGT